MNKRLHKHESSYALSHYWNIGVKPRMKKAHRFFWLRGHTFKSLWTIIKARFNLWRFRPGFKTHRDPDGYFISRPWLPQITPAAPYVDNSGASSLRYVPQGFREYMEAFRTKDEAEQKRLIEVALQRMRDAIAKEQTKPNE